MDISKEDLGGIGCSFPITAALVKFGTRWTSFFLALLYGIYSMLALILLETQNVKTKESYNNKEHDLDIRTILFLISFFSCIFQLVYFLNDTFGKLNSDKPLNILRWVETGIVFTLCIIMLAGLIKIKETMVYVLLTSVVISYAGFGFLQDRALKFKAIGAFPFILRFFPFLGLMITVIRFFFGYVNEGTQSLESFIYGLLFGLFAIMTLQMAAQAGYVVFNNQIATQDFAKNYENINNVLMFATQTLCLAIVAAGIRGMPNKMLYYN